MHTHNIIQTKGVIFRIIYPYACMFICTSFTVFVQYQLIKKIKATSMKRSKKEYMWIFEGRKGKKRCVLIILQSQEYKIKVVSGIWLFL